MLMTEWARKEHHDHLPPSFPPLYPFGLGAEKFVLSFSRSRRCRIRRRRFRACACQSEDYERTFGELRHE